MQKETTKVVTNFRRSETTFDLLWEMYHNSGFTNENEYGFGYVHHQSGLKAIMPRFFYKLWNGSWLDPGRTRQISVEELQEFLEMKIDCRLRIAATLGKLMDGPDEEKWFVLPGLVETWDNELTDVLLTVEWNVMDDLEAHALLRADIETAVGEVKYWHETEDPRGTDGKQYIVLPVSCFKALKDTWVYEWWQLLIKSNHLLDEFDTHKAEYKAKFTTKIIPLVPEQESYSWIQTADNTTIVWTNAFGDRFPHRFWHDEIGWQGCLKEYDFLAELRQ